MTETDYQPADPLALARQRVTACKQTFTKSAADLLAGKPNAEEHARIALAALVEARAHLAALENLSTESANG